VKILLERSPTQDNHSSKSKSRKKQIFILLMIFFCRTSIS
jgi:hypothetical protein